MTVSLEKIKEAGEKARAHMTAIVAGDRKAIARFTKLANGDVGDRALALSILRFAGLVDKRDRPDGSADLIYPDPYHPALRIWRGEVAGTA